jgi:hypothetical protein
MEWPIAERQSDNETRSQQHTIRCGVPQDLIWDHYCVSYIYKIYNNKRFQRRGHYSNAFKR